MIMARMTLLDCSRTLIEEVKKRFPDFSVESGTLGSVFSLPRDGNFHQLGHNYEFPTFISETDVFIIDLSFSLKVSNCSELTYLPKTERGLWVKAVDGFLDTRIIGAAEVYK